MAKSGSDPGSYETPPPAHPHTKIATYKVKDCIQITFTLFIGLIMTEEHKEKIRAGVAKAKAARDAKKYSGIPPTLDPQPPFVPAGHIWESPVPANVETRSFQSGGHPGQKVWLTKEQAQAAGHFWRD